MNFKQLLLALAVSATAMTPAFAMHDYAMLPDLDLDFIPTQVGQEVPAIEQVAPSVDGTLELTPVVADVTPVVETTVVPEVTPVVEATVTPEVTQVATDVVATAEKVVEVAEQTATPAALEAAKEVVEAAKEVAQATTPEAVEKAAETVAQAAQTVATEAAKEASPVVAEAAKEVATEAVKAVEVAKTLTPAEVRAANRAADYERFYKNIEPISAGIAAFGTGAAHYVSKALTFVGGSKAERPASWKNVIGWMRFPFAKLAEVNNAVVVKHPKKYAFGTVVAILALTYATKKAYDQIKAYRAKKAVK